MRVKVQSGTAVSVPQHSLAALRVLGSGAQKVIFEAVLNAGGPAKKPVASATEADRKRLKFLEEQSDTLLGAMEQAKAKGAGQ